MILGFERRQKTCSYFVSPNAKHIKALSTGHSYAKRIYNSIGFHFKIAFYKYLKNTSIDPGFVSSLERIHNDDPYVQNIINGRITLHLLNCVLNVQLYSYQVKTGIVFS